jgi:acyl carrier protein
VTGELCVAGVGLSRADGGPAASRFAPNPHAASAPMCRTGESARWLSDGALERTARPLEVSIDGHRVSLAEIEQRLAVHPAVADAVVVFDDEEPRSPRLVAFVVLRGIALYPHLFVAELSAHLAEWLPGWMIPEGYVQVAAIPREADGRVQYEALPLPERPPAPPVDGEAARPPTAQTVASIAGDVLGVPHVAADASLRDLGMSSLAAMDLTARLCSTFGVAPGVCQVLATPTVSGISERLDEALRLEDERTTTATP